MMENKRPPLSSFMQKMKEEEISSDKVIEKLRGLRGLPGKDAIPPSKQELLSLIEPLVPLAPTETELKAIITPLIPEVKDGKTPSKQELLSLIKPLIPLPIKGDDGTTPSLEELEAIVLPLIPDVEIPELAPKDLIEKINKAKTVKIKRERVEGFDEIEGLAKSANRNVQNVLSLGGSRQTAIKVSGTLLGTGINTINFVGATGTKVGDGSEVNITTSGSGGGGQVNSVVAGTGITVDSTDPANPIVSATGGGTGTVTTVSVATANGFAGTVANATTTPAITLTTSVTGVLKGNGTAISAATAGTDYQAPVTLTTTGTSGNATFTSNTLNIPNYTYTLPTASTSVLGGVKVDGTSITISGGVISATTGGSGTVTSVTSADANATVANTTTTPVITIVSAPKWATARNLAGNSVDGSANVAFANKFIVQGTTDAGLSGAQFLGALTTGIVKNTTTTGVLSIAVAADFPTLNQNTTGSAATLTTPRAINGINFDGSAAITVTAAAGTLTGTTLNSTVVTSSITTLGTSASFPGSPTTTTQSPSDNSTKVATTAYVDAAVLGQNFKEAALVATTANLVGVYVSGVFTYTATGTDNIDGVNLALGNRVLVKNQTTTFQNGIYVVTTAGSLGVAGVLTRSSDANTSGEFKTGDALFVTSGTVNASTTWAYTGVDSPTLGTDAITYAQIAGLGSYVAGNGLTLTGNSFAIDTSITVDKTTAQTLTNKSIAATQLTGTLQAGQFPALTGDITTTAGALATTLATVNTNTGSFGSATQVATFTVNGKGLITAAGNTTVTPAVGSITGLGTGVGTWLATPSFTNLNSAVTGDSVVGLAATQTLTNKSVNGVTLVNGGTSTLYLSQDGTYTTPSGGGSSFTWNTVTATTQTAAINNGYITNNAGLVTVTLPSTAAVGSIVEIAGQGAGGWKVAQTTSVLINFGSAVTTTGTGGSLASTNQFDAVRLLCITANTGWVVLSSIGNITIV